MIEKVSQNSQDTTNRSSAMESPSNIKRDETEEVVVHTKAKETIEAPKKKQKGQLALAMEKLLAKKNAEVVNDKDDETYNNTSGESESSREF